MNPSAENSQHYRHNKPAYVKFTERTWGIYCLRFCFSPKGAWTNDRRKRLAGLDHCHHHQARTLKNPIHATRPPATTASHCQVHGAVSMAASTGLTAVRVWLPPGGLKGS